ncbi:MAG: hypothetical protein GY913_05065 [Proteobacteria bacterium]|nr:hypothetical protein [Pseudomonadota bacterium]MCP4916271.1 hypothetical protein [Pseudomonadota bacterium]
MVLLTLFACEGEPEPGSDVPDFNYIPGYSDACLPDYAGVDDAIAATAGRVSTDTFLVAHHFEICSDDMDSSCAPCSLDPNDAEYNAMALLVSEFDDWGSTEAQAMLVAEDVTPSMFPGIFSDALAYPWRHLLVHGTENAESFALSPGIANNCTLSAEQGGEGCGDDPEYRMALEALDAECTDYRNEVSGSFSSTTVTTSAPGDTAFGFQVPLVAPDDLRPVTDFPSVPELEKWLGSVPKATVRVDNPVVSVETSGDQLCGRIEGYLDPATFGSFLDGDDALDAYRDSSGGIPVTLTVELHETTVETEVAP